MKLQLRDVSTDFVGFDRLIRLFHECRGKDDAVLDLHLSQCSWMDANLCAPLGAVLTALSRSQIRLPGVRPALQGILQKNAFLPNFGFNLPRKADTFGTTIEYRRFDRTGIQAFMSYVTEQFQGKGIPDMTPALRRRFRESIAELFENAMEHSATQLGIFACGQWFPKNNRLDFTVADLGIGIRRRIEQDKGMPLEPEHAIAWAMEGQNTTRHPRAGKPGGLGLKLIREFVNLNGGSIQIVSDRGYWRCQRGAVDARRFDLPFPGTVVNIEINTADTQSYRLAHELDPKDVPF